VKTREIIPTHHSTLQSAKDRCRANDSRSVVQEIVTTVRAAASVSRRSRSAFLKDDVLGLSEHCYIAEIGQRAATDCPQNHSCSRRDRGKGARQHALLLGTLCDNDLASVSSGNLIAFYVFLDALLIGASYCDAENGQDCLPSGQTRI